MSFLGGHNGRALGELIFDATLPGERRKRLCVWRLDAYDGYARRRVGPFNHTNVRQWRELLKPAEQRLEQYAPEVDFDEWESGPTLADAADSGRLLFGTETKAGLFDWFGKDVVTTLVKQHGFYPQKIAAKKVWRSRSGSQVAFEPVLDLNGNLVSCP